MREMAEAYPGATREEEKIVLDELRKKIAASETIPEELKSLIAGRVQNVPEFLEIKIIPGGSARFQIGQIGWSRWAIRKDSLRLVEVLSAGAIAITTFVAVAGASPLLMAVSLIFAAVALADRLKNKGTSLDDEQYRILMLLKASGPTTVKDLGERLGGLHIYGESLWTEEKTLDALNMLKAVHLGDGSVEALVAQSNDGLWAVNGV